MEVSVTAGKKAPVDLNPEGKYRIESFITGIIIGIVILLGRWLSQLF